MFYAKIRRLRVKIKLRFMKFTADTIEVSTHERRLMKRSVELEPFSHDEILDLCDIAYDAFSEEFADEFELFDRRRDELDDMNEAFHAAAQFARFDTLRLARMVHGLSNVALGMSRASEWHLEKEEA